MGKRPVNRDNPWTALAPASPPLRHPQPDAGRQDGPYGAFGGGAPDPGV